MRICMRCRRGRVMPSEPICARALGFNYSGHVGSRSRFAKSGDKMISPVDAARSLPVRRYGRIARKYLRVVTRVDANRVHERPWTRDNGNSYGQVSSRLKPPHVRYQNPSAMSPAGQREYSAVFNHDIGSDRLNGILGCANNDVGPDGGLFPGQAQRALGRCAKPSERERSKTRETKLENG